MTTHIRKMTIDVLRITRENKCQPKDTWWWNDDVQKTISEKKECYKCLHHNRSDEIYRSTKKPE
jgi:Zn ribbon nucleic-acid-binding protein